MIPKRAIGLDAVVAVVATAVLLMGSAQSASAADPTLIRSDLPLWNGGHEGVWPRDCSTETAISQCSVFQTGEWRRTEMDCAPHDSPDCIDWVRLELTSAFHSRFGYQVAHDRTALNDERSNISFIATLRDDEKSLKLYALQIGVLGGSEYVLLSAGDLQQPQHLSVLDPHCDVTIPGARIRKAKHASAYRTEYCVVSTKAAMRRLAVDALNRPPLATLHWVPASEK